jgi:hypothetical protein
MKLSEIIRQTEFSHRPTDGISVGILVRDGRLFIAAAFQNPLDRNFDRGNARHEIAKRLAAFIGGNDTTRESTRFVAQESVVAVTRWIPIDFGGNDAAVAKQIAIAFRKRFKPDPANEAFDLLFTVSGSLGQVELRSPMLRDDAWTKIQSLFQ